MVAFQKHFLFSMCVCSFVQHLLIPVTGEQRLTLQTGKQSAPQNGFSYTKLSSYGYNVGDSTCIVIEVKLCYDAQIALMPEDDDSRPMYNFLLGGWGNSRSIIRKQKFSDDFEVVRRLRDVVDCSEFRKFKFGWQCGNIVVYRWKLQSEWEVFMSLYDTSMSVNYIGVSAGRWAAGDWIIHNEGCYQITNWARDLALDNRAIQSSPRLIVDYPIPTTWECAHLCQKDKDCCFFTYNERQQDCGGYSTSTSYNASAGTQIWKRQALEN